MAYEPDYYPSSDRKSGATEKQLKDQLVNLNKYLTDTVDGLNKALQSGGDPSKEIKELRRLRELLGKQYKSMAEDAAKELRLSKAQQKYILKSNLSSNPAMQPITDEFVSNIKAQVRDMAKAFRPTSGPGLSGIREAYKRAQGAMADGIYNQVSAVEADIKRISGTFRGKGNKEVRAALIAQANERKANLRGTGYASIQQLADARTSAMGSESLGKRIEQKAHAQEVGRVFGDTIARSPFLSKKIAADLKGGGGGFLAKLMKFEETGSIGGHAAGVTSGAWGKFGMGMASQGAGGMGKLFTAITGMSGVLTYVTAAAGILGKFLAAGLSSVEYQRRLSGTAGTIGGIGDENFADRYSTRLMQGNMGVGGLKRMMYGVSVRPYLESASGALGKSGLAGLAPEKGGVGSADYLNNTVRMTESIGRAGLYAKMFGKSMEEGNAAAMKIYKAMGPTNLERTFAALNIRARQFNMDFDDVASSLGDITDLASQFGSKNVMGIYGAGMGSMAGLGANSQAEKMNIMRSFQSILNAPLTYQAGLAMAAGGEPALKGLLGNRNVLGALKGNIGALAGQITGQIDQAGGYQDETKHLYKSVAYGRLFQNEALSKMLAYNKDDYNKFVTALNKPGGADVTVLSEMMTKASSDEKYMSESMRIQSKSMTVLERIHGSIDEGFKSLTDILGGGVGRVLFGSPKGGGPSSAENAMGTLRR
jgi:hypothetical protein